MPRCPECGTAVRPARGAIVDLSKKPEPTFTVDITPSHITDPQDQVTESVDWDTIQDFLKDHSDLLSEWYMERKASGMNLEAA